MKHLTKTISFILAALICCTVICVGAYSASADTSFDEGDYRFTLTSDTTVMVSKYYGDKTKIELPDHAGGRLVTGIYSKCFENSNLVSVAIPRGYSSIGVFAFNGCTSLETVCIPSGLQSIGIMAFNGCSALKNIDFKTAESLSTISFAAFSDCTSLESVELPDSVRSIGDNAFCNCSLLSDLSLSKNLTSIGEYAFYDCAELTEVFLPESITSIGENAFGPMTDTGDIDVICYKDTFAAEYCAENNIQNLILIDKYIGDANSDGTVSISDATVIQQYIANMLDETGVNLSAADVDGSGTVDVDDAKFIQRFLAKYYDPYHINRTSASY